MTFKFSDLLHEKTYELVCRWYVFIFLNLYGTGKILGQQFYRQGEIPIDVGRIPLNEAGAFELAWTFMGYSSHYIFFIGFSQIIGAWLLLWNRTKLLGVAILIPIMVNIVVFDIIFLDAYGALANASIYLIMLLAILYFNKEKIITAFQALIQRKENASRIRIPQIIAVLIIMAIIFMIDQSLVNLLGHGKG